VIGFKIFGLMPLLPKMSGVGHRMIPDLAGPRAVERSWMAVIRKSQYVAKDWAAALDSS
jgi:hypothetical protein